MANKNLKPVRTKAEARERGRNGGIKSGQKRAERKTLREELLLLLSNGNNQNRMSLALIEKAMNGDTKAFEVVRDTIGEKPVDKAAVATGNTIEEALKRVEGDEY